GDKIKLRRRNPWVLDLDGECFAAAGFFDVAGCRDAFAPARQQQVRPGRRKLRGKRPSLFESQNGGELLPWLTQGDSFDSGVNPRASATPMHWFSVPAIPSVTIQHLISLQSIRVNNQKG